MAYTAADVKNLRERTGAGMMDCKKALDESGGDFEAAVDALRAKGLAAAAKKSSRTAAEGLVGRAFENKRQVGGHVVSFRKGVERDILENASEQITSERNKAAKGGERTNRTKSRENLSGLGTM